MRRIRRRAATPSGNEGKLKMKKLLLVTVAVLACLAQAETRDSLPREVQGIWCADEAVTGFTSSGTYKKLDDCPGDRQLAISSYRFDAGDESSCDIMKVKVVPGRTGPVQYKITSLCEAEGDKFEAINTIWLDNKGTILKRRFDSYRPAVARER
jgi:hypothetical protein